MQEREEKLWESPPLSGTNGRWLVYRLWISINPRTGAPSHKLEVRMWGPTGSYDNRVGPYKYFIITPVDLWPHLCQAAAEAERILSTRGLLSATPPKSRWPGGYVSKEILCTSPRVGSHFVEIILECWNEATNNLVHHKVSISGCEMMANGSTTILSLTLEIASFPSFLEHLTHIGEILQERGLTTAPQIEAA